MIRRVTDFVWVWIQNSRNFESLSWLQPAINAPSKIFFHIFKFKTLPNPEQDFVKYLKRINCVPLKAIIALLAR